MVRSTWAKLTEGLSAQDLVVFTVFRKFCRGLEGSEERVHSAEVQYAVTRIFTSAYAKSHYLEVGVELLREAAHPMLRTAFATSKRVTMHRVTLREPAQFDDALSDLIVEARDTVGPGFR
jgi:hypothetical protein